MELRAGWIEVGFTLHWSQDLRRILRPQPRHVRGRDLHLPGPSRLRQWGISFETCILAFGIRIDTLGEERRRMSTFKGIVDEFPDIRIDYFRQSNDPNARAPLACFLTHIHSDHIQGLDGFYGGPFIYCSAATKELLLRLERRTHRWSLAKGVLESRKCQYAEKKTKLKVIPMETPTMVELSGDRSVRVTLFDVSDHGRRKARRRKLIVEFQANHCPGAVMFLIEGDGKAVLYTGDIRAEPWWVSYLCRHPILIPYTAGIKHFDKIYLDTSFAGRTKTHQLFSPKHEGIRELLEKVGKYPQDTIFHFNTWTFGYEDVWVALAAAFNTKIHLSDYHFRLFHFIRDPETYTLGPYLKGFKCGNADIPGCLTRNPNVRFHSCERKAGCYGLEGKNKVVWVTPIITRMGDFEVHEPGSGDLENQDDLVLHENHLQLLLDGLGPDVDPRVKELLESARNTRKQALPLDLFMGDGAEDLGLPRLLEILSKAVVGSSEADVNLLKNNPIEDMTIKADNGELLPNKITFPYSRHSSHSELRGLVSVFRPRDIYPCVVDDAGWDESKTMEYLFGDLCEGNEFAHDKEMRVRVDEERRIQEVAEDERVAFEMESQMMLNRTQLNSLPELLKEQLGSLQGDGPLAKTKTMVSSASCSPTSSQPATPRLPKRTLQDDSENDDTPKARKLNSLFMRNSNELTSSPPLPPMLARELDLPSSYLTPLEQARLAGSSTASSSQQSSPVKPRPTRPTWGLGTVREDPTPQEVPRTPKRIKREEHSSLLQEFFDASDIIETTPRAAQGSSDTLEYDVLQPLAKSLEGQRQRLRLAILDNKLDPSMNEEEVLEAMEAVLGVNGRNWWDVGLRCTEKKWRYVEEVEL